MYTCRANLEQAEQFRHDSYELPQRLKYQGLLITQNAGHGLNHEYLVFYFGKHIGKGNMVTAISPQTIPNIQGMHRLKWAQKQTRREVPSLPHSPMPLSQGSFPILTAGREKLLV